MSSIKVLVVRPDHSSWRGVLDAVQAIPNASVVAETSQLAEIVPLCERHSPDWIVAAASIEDESTHPALTEVRRRHGADVRLVIIDWALNYRNQVKGFLKLDPAGYFVWQELTSFALPAYLDSILTGATVIGAAVSRTRGTMPSMASGLVGDPPKITDRQREVLRMLAVGLTRTEITAQLSVSPETVQRDIRSLREAFNAYTDAEMMHQATCFGLVQ